MTLQDRINDILSSISTINSTIADIRGKNYDGEYITLEQSRMVDLLATNMFSVQEIAEILQRRN